MFSDLSSMFCPLPKPYLERRTKLLKNHKYVGEINTYNKWNSGWDRKRGRKFSPKIEPHAFYPGLDSQQHVSPTSTSCHVRRNSEHVSNISCHERRDSEGVPPMPCCVYHDSEEVSRTSCQRHGEVRSASRMSCQHCANCDSEVVSTTSCTEWLNAEGIVSNVDKPISKSVWQF